ncbi:MAG: lipoprotein-releasing ABC transporter permease subunit [Steroidobacteraceae bacterium]|jgi:lipoprotein-releasing system permease protein|nr:lipoprotein-releasing ABC transporter permease subunit [Steroidobacteraceae bacterium]
MIRPLELYVGLRYVRSREAGFFVSFITWVSLAGVALGVAALITILSVMNGFEGELRGRLLSLSSHATLTAPDPAAPLPDWRAATARIEATPGVVGVAPYVEQQALLTFGGEMSGAVLRGVDPALEPRVSEVDRTMVDGDFASLEPGRDRIVLGRVLAFQLGAGLGDTITVMVPQGEGADGELVPRIRSYTVSGIFEVGLQDHDSVLALVHLADAEALVGRDGPQGLRLEFDDVFRAPAAAAALADSLGLRARDWTQENATYFRAIRIEKTMMTLILLLVVAVAAFNIVATLVMVVRAKRTDIAILRTLGLEPRGVVGVFLSQGIVIGWAGTAFGVVAGLLLAANVESVVPWLERTFGFQILDADVYYITRIPSTIEAGDVVLVAGTAFLLTLLSTIYPALRAARTQPAEALRYE